MQVSVLLLRWGSYRWACNLLLLIIYSFFSLLCCPLCFQGSPQTRQRECFLVFGNFSPFKIPFLGQSSLPTSFVSFFHLLYFFLPVFEDNDLLFWVPDVLCQHSEVVLWNLLSAESSFDESVREKVVSPSYSSTILGPPPEVLLFLSF